MNSESKLSTDIEKSIIDTEDYVRRLVMCRSQHPLEEDEKKELRNFLLSISTQTIQVCKNISENSVKDSIKKDGSCNHRHSPSLYGLI